MFEDSLVESSGRIKTKRAWTTIASFGMQFGLVGIMILLPLIYTEALPKASLTTFLVAPPPPPPPPPPPQQMAVVHKVQTNIVEGALRTPTKIPNKIVKVVEDEAPQPAGVIGGVAGGMPGGSTGGVLGGILAATNAPPPKVATPQKLRVSSGVIDGMALSKPTPLYPPIARQAHISGTVVLQATISKQGTIENLHVVSGHPMLVQSALQAVRQWRYKPYYLNGEPVEVETTINVNFNLGG